MCTCLCACVYVHACVCFCVCVCVCELPCLCTCGYALVLAPHGVTAALHVPVEMLVVWYGLSGKEKATVVVEGGEGEGEGEGH